MKFQAFTTLLVLIIGCFLISATLKAQLVGNPEPIFENERAQVETPIAINPTDPDNLIGAAITQSDSVTDNWIGIYHSLNGGEDWTGNHMFAGPETGDPVVAFDPDGNAYLLYQKQGDSGLYLHKSTDGGVSWLGSTTVVLFNPNDHKVDRPWMAVSPVRNMETGYFDIYICFTLFEEPVTTERTHIKVYKSSDGGQTFSEWYNRDGDEFEGVHGSFVAAGPDGRVFIAYVRWEADGKKRTPIKLTVIGKESGGTPITSTTVDIHQIGSWDTEKGNWYLKQLKVRADSYPRIAVDNSYGNNKGNIYLVWSDKQPASGDTPDIMMLIGEDSGSGYSWTTATIDGASGDQWMPAVSVSPDGIVSVLYYSSNPGVSDPNCSKRSYPFVCQL